MKEGEYIAFDDLLANLNISEENYSLDVRSSLKCANIFLKRKPGEF